MTDANLGHALPLPTPSPELEARLASRRSASAQTLIAPGPTPTEIERILTLAARTPDHGKLFPWRFVVMGPARRAALAEALRPLAVRQADPGKAARVLVKLTAPPVSILVVSAPVVGH
ncbi:MAG TPA: nitroreductase family protein, partial [Brevundimonas sp.]|nr:nitroreductase family protein [Brevundimonas sp.]